MRGRKRKTRLLTDIYQTTEPVGEANSVGGVVTLDLVLVAPSGQSPPPQGPVLKEKVLPEEPSNDMPTFQVVNVVEDLDTGQAEGTGICIRKRRKQASAKW